MRKRDLIEKLAMKCQRPGRYTGGELNSVIKDKNKVDLRFAFCFPDTYEVGMSHLGIKILYGCLNRIENIWCERVFAPQDDMAELMRENGVSLYALESLDSVSEFDMVGFTLQYEMSYTNVLYMLDLAGIPLYSCERTGLKNIVIGGGPCVCNAEPVADFFDILQLGEGEEMLPEICEEYIKAKNEGVGKQEFLRRVSKIEGVYVPSFYNIEYNSDGTVKKIIPLDETVPTKIKKRIISDFDRAYYPEDIVVPFVEVIHDRAVLEIMRGCMRGCRFCQAGYIYRPLREKTPSVLNCEARRLCDSTGYDEMSLSSLSTSDYSALPELLEKLLAWTDEERINLSLPSLRVDNFSKELLTKISSVRQSGLTFAPEAGTQRLRNVINKNVSEEEIERTALVAFEGGHSRIKLYFMIGLPTETDEDVVGIVETAQKIVNLFYSRPGKPKGKGVSVSISVATFVPKPFTPFQWEPQDSREEIIRKQKLIHSSIRSKKINYSYHDMQTSFIEATLARGDRRLSRVLEYAYRSGCHLDSWGENFDYEKWIKAFAACGLDPCFYANRRRERDEILPWELMDTGINKEFLVRECERAYAAQTTKNCREGCAGCGANNLTGGKCVVKRQSEI